MKTTIITTVLLLLLSVSCIKQNESESHVKTQQESDTELIKRMGYDVSEIYQYGDGYVVEGDIYLTGEHLKGFQNLELTRQTQNYQLLTVGKDKHSIELRYTGSPLSYNNELIEAINYWNEKSKCDISLSLNGDAVIEITEEIFWDKWDNSKKDTLTLMLTTPPTASGNPGSIKINNKCHYRPVFDGEIYNKQGMYMLLHAIGHALGFGHTPVDAASGNLDPEVGTHIFGTKPDDSKSIMVKESKTQKWNGFSPDDVKAFQAIYPKPGTPEAPDPQIDIDDYEWMEEDRFVFKTRICIEGDRKLAEGLFDFKGAENSPWVHLTTATKYVRIFHNGKMIFNGTTKDFFTAPTYDGNYEILCGVVSDYGVGTRFYFYRTQLNVYMANPRIRTNINLNQIDFTKQFYLYCDFYTWDTKWGKYTGTATLTNKATGENLPLHAVPNENAKWNFSLKERGTYEARMTINNGTETKTVDTLIVIPKAPANAVFYKIQSRYETDVIANPEKYIRYYLEFYSDEACTNKITSTKNTIEFDYILWSYYYNIHNILEEEFIQEQGTLLVPIGSSSFNLPILIANYRPFTLDGYKYKYEINNIHYK